MSSNVFAVLRDGNRKNTRKAKDAESNDKKRLDMLRFADSTLAWDDDSDSRSSPKATIRTDDISNEGEIDSQDSENESESESEEEDGDEEKDECEGPVQNTDKTIKEKVKTPVKILSKKEKKKIEMEELESVLADLGIPVEDSRTNGENGNEQVEVPVDGVNGTIKKTKKKKKKATTTKDTPPVHAPESTICSETPACADIKTVIKSKGKKKKAGESTAVKLAREEALKAKNKKKNRDKALFNQF
ncbi:hypothetical protein ABG067_006089 [Albugo candida]